MTPTPNEVAKAMGLPLSPEVKMRLTCPKCGDSWTGFVSLSASYYCSECSQARRGVVALHREAVA